MDKIVEKKKRRFPRQATNSRLTNAFPAFWVRFPWGYLSIPTVSGTQFCCSLPCPVFVPQAPHHTIIASTLLMTPHRTPRGGLLPATIGCPTSGEGRYGKHVGGHRPPCAVWRSGGSKRQARYVRTGEETRVLRERHFGRRLRGPDGPDLSGRQERSSTVTSQRSRRNDGAGWSLRGDGRGRRDHQNTQHLVF